MFECALTKEVGLLLSSRVNYRVLYTPTVSGTRNLVSISQSKIFLLDSDVKIQNRGPERESQVKSSFEVFLIVNQSVLD